LLHFVITLARQVDEDLGVIDAIEHK
jgi:hypothetical protein